LEDVCSTSRWRTPPITRCADPSGRQVAFVFAVESKLFEQLGNRDLAMVQSVSFQPIRVPATAAGK